MKTLNKIIFSLKEVFSGLFRNVSKTVVHLLVCYVSLVFFSVVFGAHYNIQDAAKNMRSELEISVFIKDDALPEDVLAIEDKIKSNSSIVNYAYVSKEDARRKGEAMFEDTPEMLEAVEGLQNPFPSSFNIELSDPSLTESIASEFMNMNGVESDGVKYGEEYIEQVLALSNGLSIVSYLALAFFFTVAVFFMVSIVNVILNQKEQETKIKFLIGASAWQIKLPFYLQGLIMGLVSSGLAYVTFKYGYLYLSDNLSFMLSDITVIEFKLFLIMIITGVASGLLATKVALTKFDKTKRSVSKTK